MSKFAATFEDNTLEGLQRQIVDYLFSFNGFGPANGTVVNPDDQGGKDPLAEEPSPGNDQPD